MTRVVTEVESFEINGIYTPNCAYLRTLLVIPKGLAKNGKSEREGGLTIMEFRGHGGVMHFGISKGIGGLKYGSRPLVGTDIFWNRPIICSKVYNL